jgi:hypothetical protein
MINASVDEEMMGHWRHLKDVTESHPSLLTPIFENVDVIDGWGLAVRDGEVLISGQPDFGWSEDHISQVMRKIDLSCLTQLPKLDAGSRPYLALLSFPGAYTYGHWFIDILPRIETVLETYPKNEVRFILPGPLPAWARPFLDVYGLSPADIIEIDQGERLHAPKLIIPGLRRISDYLSPTPHGSAFGRIRAYGHAQALGQSDLGPYLLVEHEAQTSIGQRATLDNFEALKQALAPHGFRPIKPASMTFNEQIAAFSEAKIIIGEDSSALHNIIFSTNANVFVICGRKNLLHLSISKLLGHSCYYFYTDSSNEPHFICDVDSICKFIINII